MQSDPNGGSMASDAHARESEWANEEPTAFWPDTAAGRVAAKDRLARLARTIETDVIPRLVQAHRPGAANPQPGSAVAAGRVGDWSITSSPGRWGRGR